MFTSLYFHLTALKRISFTVSTMPIYLMLLIPIPVILRVLLGLISYLCF